MFTDSRGMYQVRASSANFYEWYKSLDLNQVVSLIQGYEKPFVRGFYEWVYIEDQVDYTYRYPTHAGSY